MTETKTETAETKPSRLARDAYSLRHLRYLASRPASCVSNLLRFLDGPLSLDELAEEIRRADTYGGNEEFLTPGWPMRAALATLHHAGIFLERRESRFHLAEEYRESVELYAAIARSTAAVERSNHYDRMVYYGDRVAAAGLKSLACEMVGAGPDCCEAATDPTSSPG